MEAALPFSLACRSPARLTFVMKVAGAALLIALADRLFYLPDQVGATLGLFALGLLVTTIVLRPEIWRRRGALLSAAAAGLFALLLIEDPGVLAFALCWASLSLAVLLPRAQRFGSGWRWLLRLLAHSLSLPEQIVRDGKRLAASKRRSGAIGITGRLPTLILPIGGSLIFLLLFAAANPLIEDALVALHPLAGLRHLSLSRLALWGFVLMLSWGLLRPRLRFRTDGAGTDEAPLPLPGVSAHSVTLSLFAFNAIFAAQNGLDIAFLWSGARLPEGMTFAQYAHRGAYPLIGTALLAGLFVLVTLRPGSQMATSTRIRRLVYLWIGQNVFLVASTMLRTFRYVEAYSLTELRIEALIWMGLVAAGLILICLRLWRDRSDTWLINANLAAATLILSVSAAADYDRLAAGWNVRHAREAGGAGASLDLCYLNWMGASALLPLIELESRRLPPLLRQRVAWVRNDVMDRLEARQADWAGWTWRGARRLEAAQGLIAEKRLPRFAAPPRQCDGSAFPISSVAAPALPPVEVAPPRTPLPQPLTATPGR